MQGQATVCIEMLHSRHPRPGVGEVDEVSGSIIESRIFFKCGEVPDIESGVAKAKSRIGGRQRELGMMGIASRDWRLPTWAFFYRGVVPKQANDKGNTPE